jgi:hypothetical protein
MKQKCWIDEAVVETRVNEMTDGMTDELDDRWND